MSYEERGTWVYLFVSAAVYAAYAAVVLARAADPITETAYQAPLLWAIGASIAASIVLRIVVEIGAGVARGVSSAVRQEIAQRAAGEAVREAGGAGSGTERPTDAVRSAAAPQQEADAYRTDDRDREIDRMATVRTLLVLVAGALAALGMALAEWPHFWIANVIYLAFVLQAVSSAVVKIVAYRRGF